MKLYGALASPYVARVVLFARLKGIDLPTEMPPGGIKTPEYLARNPMGKMPMLEADGFALPESAVICEYLEDLHPGTGGLPGGAQDRARARLIERVQDLYVSPHATTFFRNVDPAKRDAAAVANAVTGITAGYGYVEQLMVGSPFAAGASLSIADCALLPGLVMLRHAVFPALGLADPTAGSEKIGRWWSTMHSEAVTAKFIAEYKAAVDAFMKMMARR